MGTYMRFSNLLVIVARLRTGNYRKIGHVCLSVCVCLCVCVCVCICLSVC